MTGDQPDEAGFTDDELRDLVTAVMILIHSSGELTEDDRARIAAKVRPQVEAAIKRRGTREQG